MGRCMCVQYVLSVYDDIPANKYRHKSSTICSLLLSVLFIFEIHKSAILNTMNETIITSSPRGGV